MRGDDGKLSEKVPNGLFPLELPGSQGSHPGHSSILQGNPATLDSGRVSEADFARLANRAKGGFIERSDFGQFIERTLLRDPKPKVLELNAAQLLVGDFGVLVQTIGGTQGTILAGPVDGGCGSTNGRRKAHQAAWGGQSCRVVRRVWPALRFSDQQAESERNRRRARVVAERRAGHVLDMTLPIGWQSWKKRRVDWTVHATGLLLSAANEISRRKKQRFIVTGTIRNVAR